MAQSSDPPPGTPADGTLTDVGRETAARIERAALELFSTEGYNAVGIRNLAEAAGIRTSTLYHYFPTKQDILLRITRVNQNRLLGAVQSSLAPLRLPEERLATLVLLHVLSHAEYPLAARVLDMELRNLPDEMQREVIAGRDHYESSWQSALDDGVAAGTFHVGNTRITRLALIEMCTGVAYWFHPGELSADQIADEYADLALALVQARRGRRQLQTGDLSLPSHAQLRGYLGLS
jgi:AcrR family transcriptional regulator